MYRNRLGRCFLAWLLFFGQLTVVQRAKPSFRDSLDNKLDMSDYIINFHGFIPIPSIITEPALGNFGGVLAPVFLKKKMPVKDSVDGKVRITPLAPDIKGVGAGYTANNSWFAGGFASGTWAKPMIKYKLGVAYGNINMSFSRQLPVLGERSFDFNIETVTFFAQGTKRLGTSKWYSGVKYLLTDSQVEYRPGGALPDFVKPIELKSIVSKLGVLVEYDSRDNVFSPNNGMKFHIDAGRSDKALGSDYEFWRMNYFAYLYRKLWEDFVFGLRLDGQQNFGDAPFYQLPFLDLRGMPVNRYQGKATTLAELEVRWDFTSRWSLMGYSGTGKAFDDWGDWGKTDLETAYGTGLRYLLARKFGLRMGMDVAHGPDNWAYYIVFGSSWR